MRHILLLIKIENHKSNKLKALERIPSEAVARVFSFIS